VKIIGCDLHARQQTLAMLDTTTGAAVTGKWITQTLATNTPVLNTDRPQSNETLG